MTWPKHVGQIPIFYNHKNTGRPAPEELQAMEDIPIGAWQSSLSNTSRYLDLGTQPRYPFGHGLTYSTFAYSDLKVEPATIPADGTVEISFTLANTGERKATEVVQLYTRDSVAQPTRPVRELRRFERITLDPGKTQQVTFQLPASELAFYTTRGETVSATGEIQLWVGWNAQEGLEGRFEIAGNTP